MTTIKQFFYHSFFPATLQHRFDNELLSPEKQDNGYYFDVILEKEPQFGIGITIVGGEDTGTINLGIFVKTVLPGGPADKDGRIRPGDRLLAINEESVHNMQQAVQLIKNAKNFVKLCVSQIRAPRSVRRKIYDDVIPTKLCQSEADPTDILIYQHINSLHEESFDEDDVNSVPHIDVCADVHAADVSTMSQIESIKSEIVENEFPESCTPHNTGKFTWLLWKLNQKYCNRLKKYGTISHASVNKNVLTF